MSIRLRIALWTASIMLISLLALSAGVYYTMSRNLHEDLDARLRSVYDQYRRSETTVVRTDSAGNITAVFPPRPDSPRQRVGSRFFYAPCATASTVNA